MIDVKTFQIHEAIQVSAEKLRITKVRAKTYEIDKMVLKDTKSCYWRTWFTPFISQEIRATTDLHPIQTIIGAMAGELENIESNVNEADFIRLNHVDVAIDIAVKYMAEYAGILSTDLMFISNASNFQIDLWGFSFQCMNEENQQIYVDIRVDTEKQEVFLLGVS